MVGKLAFEICVDSVESAVAAQDGGADRVELCDNLFEGGTTPSYGAIELARNFLDIKLHVIIRPRGGDFLYSDIEFEIMKRDIDSAKKLGVDGIVIGVLRSDGCIDTERTAELTEIARPMSVTFHRAFDVCSDPFSALEDLISIGIDRVLTSGQRPNGVEGSELIGKLVEKADGRILILACGSLDESNIADVINKTHVSETHFTAFEEIASKMEFCNETVAMGSDDAGSEYVRRVTTAQRVRSIIDLAK